MALMRCLDCTTRFAPGLHRCPHCTGTRCERDDGMPKITKHGGPSDASASATGVETAPVSEPEAVAKPAPRKRARARTTTKAAEK